MSAPPNHPHITPFFWFDSNAEEAVNLYVSTFPNSRILEIVRNPPSAPGIPGTILTIAFELDGVYFTALNGGPLFHFTEAISFVIHCRSQQEIDHYWAALTSNGGAESQCGWLKDRFGLSWQIVPARIQDLIRHPKAMQAMLKMRKLDIAALQRAANEP